MIINLVLDVFKLKNRTVPEKLKTLAKFAEYYKNLSDGITSDRIYHRLTAHNIELNNFLNSLTQKDFDLIEVLFRKNIKEFLAKTELKNYLDFDKKIGLTQIGYNSIYVSHQHVGLWTTGKATFYIPTKTGVTNKITIELFSVVPMNVRIGFENERITSIHMQKLATRKIDMILEQEKITEGVSEIYIDTDRLWLPGTLLRIEDTIAIGVCVKSILVTYC